MFDSGLLVAFVSQLLNVVQVALFAWIGVGDVMLGLWFVVLVDVVDHVFAG